MGSGGSRGNGSRRPRTSVGGTLIFTMVSRVESSRSLDALEWGEDRLDGEILTVKPVAEGEEGVEFVITLTDYTSRASDVLVLCIFSEDIAWIPETGQA